MVKVAKLLVFAGICLVGGCGKVGISPEALPSALRHVVTNQSFFAGPNSLSEVSRNTVMDDLGHLGGCWERTIGRMSTTEEVSDLVRDEFENQFGAAPPVFTPPPFEPSAYWFEVLELKPEDGTITIWWAEEVFGFVILFGGSRGTYTVTENSKLTVSITESFTFPDPQKEGETDPRVEFEVIDQTTGEWLITRSGEFMKIWFTDQPENSFDVGVFRQFDCSESTQPR